MKKHAKEILLVIGTTIIVSAISVSAMVYFNSENVTFTPTNTDWNVTNTSAALNDLYSFTTNGNALASDILNGKTALVNGELITGTMADNGAINETIAPGGSYTIPAGFHNGSGKVTANKSSSDEGPATVTLVFNGTWINKNGYQSKSSSQFNTGPYNYITAYPNVSGRFTYPSGNVQKWTNYTVSSTATTSSNDFASGTLTLVLSKK